MGSSPTILTKFLIMFNYLKGVLNRLASTVCTFFFIGGVILTTMFAGILEVPCYILFNWSPLDALGDLVSPYIDYD